MVCADTRDTSAPKRFGWKFSALGRRVVMVMLLTAHFFAALATAAQIFAQQRQYEARKIHLLEYIRDDLVPRLEDHTTSNQLRDVIAALPGVATVDISARDRDVARPADMRMTSPAGEISILFAPHELRSSAFDLFASNLLRTVVTGMIMLIIFDRIAARHLRQIAEQVRSIHWMDKNSPIKLERDSGIFPDEIDSIIDALESMRSRSLEAYDSLSSQAEKLRHLNKSMRTVNREQAELTYALSHDLIAPINTLDMLLEDIAEHPGEISGTALETITDMQTSTRRMRAQIEAVQVYAHLLQNDIENRDVDLDEVIAAALDTLRDEIDATGASIRCDKIGHVVGHPTSFQKVFVEILRNALRYRDTRHPLSICIEATEEPAGEMLHVVVSDTGLGIDPLYQDAVFGLFRRLHTYSDIPGNGMGLPLSRRALNRHGGKLSLTSTPGSGTTVTLTFVRKTS